MKRMGVLFLMILLLTGCGNASAPEAAPLSQDTSQIPAPRLQWTELSGGLTVCPLEVADVCGMYPMGEDLLIIRRTGDALVLLRLDPRQGRVRSSARIAPVSAGATPDFQVYPEGLCYYDPAEKRCVRLDGTLREAGQAPLPGDALGPGLLSRDGGTLFYATADAVRRLDTASGISRILKEDPAPEKSLRGLLLEETVLQCFWEGEFRFLCTETGRVLDRREGSLTLETAGKCFYAGFPNGAADSLVYGTDPGSPRLLVPANPESEGFFLPGAQAVVTVLPLPQAGQVELEYYCLESGSRLARLRVDSQVYPRYITAAGGKVYFLLYDSGRGCDLLCGWDPAQTPVRDTLCYTQAYFSRESPDAQGLEACRAYAGEIGEQFGIRVLIWQEAAALAPRDHTFAPEHQAHLIRRELARLEQQLSRYPEGFFQTLVQGTGELTICLVRGITETTPSGSRESPGGVQFWVGSDACIALVMGPGSEGALHHNLSHVTDTLVFSRSHAYDSWAELNPGDFRYDCDDTFAGSREGRQYLQPHSQSFIDLDSMVSPREDRARILEYAMTPGHGELFRAPILQQKLLKLCTGIREAFHLEEYPGILAWEQYLQEPMAPGGS